VSTSSAHQQPIAALLVATWYPSVADPGLGRYVADQAEALLRSGGVRPLVASFESAYVDGPPDARRAGALAAHLRHALASRPDVASPAAWSLTAPVGIARLPISAPSLDGLLPPGHEADERRATLEILADRLDPAGMSGVVHAHTGYPDGYAAVGAARRLGWPLVITEHASFVARQLRQPEQRWRYLEAVRAASRFIAVSDTLAAELFVAIPELEEKLVIIPNVIPLHAFQPAPPEERSPQELLFVGDRKERKGMVVLLRAFADVLEQRPGATLRLIGKSTSEADEARWKAMAQDFDVLHAIRFEGLADRAAVSAALRRASVFVHPSPRETFGVVTLEALASGLPVVAAQSGGISDILEDRRFGDLVPARDSRMLARAILRTLDRLGEFDPQTLRSAVERFSAEAVAPRLRALYEEVIAEAGGPHAPVSSATRTAPWAGRADPVGDACVLLAHDADRAARALSLVPSALLRRLTLVTYGDPARGALPQEIGRVIRTRDHITAELQRRGLYGTRRRLRDRLLRLAANPMAPIRRRLVKGGLAEVRWRASAAGIGRALQGIPAHQRDSSSAPEVFCLDVFDYAVAAPFIAEGRFRPAPGGMIWLADRWAAAHTADEPSTAAADRSVASASSAG